MPKALDLSIPLSASTPTFPGDPAIRIARVRSLERGDPYCLSSIAMGSHSGTHLDAPAHFVEGGATVDTVDLDLLNGPALVVPVPDASRTIGAAEVSPVPDGTVRVLFRSRNSARWGAGEGFFDDFVGLDDEGAKALLARGVRMVGVDGLSVEHDPSLRFPVHHRLLGAGTWIVEGLRLVSVTPGLHRLACLPLRLVGADGAPCRAVLWE